MYISSSFSIFLQIHASVSRFCIFHLHVTPFSTHRGGGGFNKRRWSTFLWKLPLKKPNLKMSVFRSNTLIFAPEFWECILLRGSDFKILPETRAFAVNFFHSPSTPNRGFCHPLKILLKTLGWGEGVYLIKVYTGRPRPEVWPLTVLYTIYDRKATCTPFVLPSIDERYPFHIPYM